ncbi:MAG: replication factor C small subunit [Nitrososphaerota archaeon]|nr:replication factor C small subunit [Candidatus Calditenuaceae archaeon]MDW8073340.1 replication factor C small subunit [Nitrososphaerota archaeon]
MALQETIPWIEKYRPRSLSQIINQEAIVNSLKTILSTHSVPHMLFTGPPGVGKTATAHAFANDLYGVRYIEDGHFLEINASDERGIDVIREKVKGFARTIPIGGLGFKILLLDEADQLTSDAQHAFRRVMEQFSATCRFILAANYANRIIEPIQSRCAVFRFKPIELEQMKLAIERIARQEGLEVDEKAMEALYEVTEGDLRRCINLLQTASTYGKKIDADRVYQVAGLAWGGEVRRLLELAVAGKLENVRKQLRTILYVNGASERDLVSQMYRDLLYLSIPEKKKLELVSLLGEVDFRISQGANPELQIMMFLTNLYSASQVGK